MKPLNDDSEVSDEDDDGKGSVGELTLYVLNQLCCQYQKK